MSDSNNIYLEFGGSSDAITSDGTLTEHEQAMLVMDVSARDGDDSIELSTDEPEEEIQEEEETNDLNDEEEHEVEAPKEASNTIDQANAEMKEGREGFESMVQIAVTNGMPQEAVDSIVNEYMEDEQLSEKSLKILEEHGFTRKFVQNYIAGQQAIVERMARGLVDFVGGADNWETIMTHLQKNDPDSLESLQVALDNNNIKMVKTVLTLTQKELNQAKESKYGKKAERSVSKSAKPQIQTQINTGPKGFSNSQEMVDAMKDKRYSTDPKYRAEVEQRVIRSNF
ncbi:capsid assembly protein [Enterobacter quasiroggenkampii]|uniref:capsid assembly protein n=1 Tax=Enterobacter quasiroggenkampii TaxID=2497436 RepID=UPI003AADC711